MSAGKLDQSLDDILKTSRTSARGGRRGARRSGAGRPAAKPAPVGGVQKAQKGAKPTKAVPTGPASFTGSGESKILISNLPQDVEENQLKDYFTAAVNVGKPKKILMQYGPNGRSLGSATVIFHKPDHAAKAMQALDNIRIDNRLIRVEVILSARDAPVPTKQASLADRVTQPKKDKPKPATVTKEKTSEAATRGRGGRGGRARGRGGRAPRDKKKTVEELDAEMEDYFPAGEGGNDAMATNGAGAGAGQTAVGDTAMDDEML